MGVLKVQFSCACVFMGCISPVLRILCFMYHFIYYFKYCLLYYLMYCLIFCLMSCFIFCCVSYCLFYRLMYCLIFYCISYSTFYTFRFLNILYLIFDNFSVLCLKLKSCLKFLCNWDHVLSFKLCLKLCFDFKLCFAISHACDNTIEGIRYI